MASLVQRAYLISDRDLGGQNHFMVHDAPTPVQILFRLDTVEAFEDVAAVEAEDDGAAVRAGRWGRGFQQAID